VRLAPLVTAVDSFLAAMNDGEWPQLTMPQIAQE
jgi:hypothetical protein